MTGTAQPTDLELLDGWAAGDYEAAAELLDRHFEGLCRFFRSKLRGDVGDLLQQTLRLGLQTRRRCRHGVSVRAHLYAIARNLLFAYDGPGAWEVTADPSALTREEEQPRTQPPNGDVRGLRAALRRLPLDHQIALELRYWERLERAELAQVLRLPEDRVSEHLQRGREMLRRELSAYGGGAVEALAATAGLEVIEDDPSGSYTSDG